MNWVRRLLGQQSALEWIAEIAGVGAIAVAASMWLLPLGIVIAGIYLIWLANRREV